MNGRHVLTTACATALFSASGCSVSSDSLIFTTYTKVGLDVSATDGTPTEAVFGYKRFEGAIVPVDETSDEPATHSVFAGLCIENSWLGGLDIHQVFATGAAAETAANRDQTALSTVLECTE
ncbi:MAG: hypothetical protein NXI30_02475 [bacterium]|nr:hypothetical protein [bacterium]